MQGLPAGRKPESQLEDTSLVLSLLVSRTALSPEAKAKASVLGPPGDKPLTLAGLRNPITVGSISALNGDIRDVHAFLASSMR